VQLQDKTEEVLANRVAHVVAGVGIEVAQLATSLTRRWGKEHARGVATFAFHEQHGHGLAFGGFQFAHQFGRRKHAGFAFFYAQYVGVESPQ